MEMSSPRRNIIIIIIIVTPRPFRTFQSFRAADRNIFFFLLFTDTIFLWSSDYPLPAEKKRNKTKQNVKHENAHN